MLHGGVNNDTQWPYWLKACVCSGFPQHIPVFSWSYMGFWVLFFFFFFHGTNNTIDAVFEAEWWNRFDTQISIPLEREGITFSSMARIMNVNLYKLCLLKKLSAKKFWSTRCARFAWQGLVADICSPEYEILWIVVCHYVNFRGGKPQKTQNPTKPHNLSPQSPHPSKKHPTTQTVQDQNGVYIKDKKDFNEL